MFKRCLVTRLLLLIIAIIFTNKMAYTQHSDSNVTVVTIVKTSSPFIGFVFYSGEKVKTGFQVSYANFHQKTNRKYEIGLVYGLIFYDIENKDNNLEGFFKSYGSAIAFRYYLKPDLKGLYFSGSIKLSFGFEKIVYGYKEESNFFFGPTFEESIGFSMNKKLLLELGLFQIKHFGSDLLPSDLGLRFSINIGL